MSLVSLCLESLVSYADQLHHLPVRLHLRSDNELSAVEDPRLWAVLAQTYVSLPPYLADYSITLTDKHLPLLQSIQSTPSFSLITLLDLPQVTDTTISQLSFITTLTAFNATNSSLSPYAIKSIASLKSLRILSLRNCKLITNDIFPHLEKFPLLSVIDLRGTRCNTHNISIPFQPSSHDLLYHPAPLKSALTTLHALHSNLYSSSNPYYLHVHANPHPKIATVTPQDAFFVIPSDNSKIQVGSSHILEERERDLIHQRNKDAWYERHESHTNYSMVPVPNRRPLVENRVPPASRISNSSWIGKNNPPKQIKSRHSFTLPSKVPPVPRSTIPIPIIPIPTIPIPRANEPSSISTKSFYNPPLKRIPSWTSSSDRDQSLKLYRPAPPWSTLSEYLAQEQAEKTAAMERQEHYTRTVPPEEEVARVDMSSTKATLMKRQLDEWTLAQTQTHIKDKEKTNAPVNGESTLLSRNPFRREQGATKPLKPISTVRVPILAPQVRKAALVREENDNLKRKRIAAEELENGEELDSIIKPGPRQKNASGSSRINSSSGFNWNAWAKNAS